MDSPVRFQRELPQESQLGTVEQLAHVPGGGAVRFGHSVGVDARHGQAAMAHPAADGAGLGYGAELGGHEMPQPLQRRANAQSSGQLPVASGHCVPSDRLVANLINREHEGLYR
jgi:hypothetical protein